MNYNQPAESDGNTLFLGDLAFFADEASLLEAFASFEPVHVQVKGIRGNGAKLGYGFIRFETAAAATAALYEMNGKMHKGRAMRIEWATDSNNTKGRRPAQDHSSVQVLVSFIGKDTGHIASEDVLRNVFEQRCGAVVDVTIKKLTIDKVANYHSGYGFIHFQDSASGLAAAQCAVTTFNNTIVDNIIYDCRPGDKLHPSILANNTTKYEQKIKGTGTVMLGRKNPERTEVHNVDSTSHSHHPHHSSRHSPQPDHSHYRALPHAQAGYRQGAAAVIQPDHRYCQALPHAQAGYRQGAAVAATQEPLPLPLHYLHKHQHQHQQQHQYQLPSQSFRMGVKLAYESVHSVLPEEASDDARYYYQQQQHNHHQHQLYHNHQQPQPFLASCLSQHVQMSSMPLNNALSGQRAPTCFHPNFQQFQSPPHMVYPPIVHMVYSPMSAPRNLIPSPHSAYSYGQACSNWKTSGSTMEVYSGQPQLQQPHTGEYTPFTQNAPSPHSQFLYDIYSLVPREHHQQFAPPFVPQRGDIEQFYQQYLGYHYHHYQQQPSASLQQMSEAFLQSATNTPGTVALATAQSTASAPLPESVKASAPILASSLAPVPTASTVVFEAEVAQDVDADLGNGPDNAVFVDKGQASTVSPTDTAVDATASIRTCWADDSPDLSDIEEGR